MSQAGFDRQPLALARLASDRRFPTLQSCSSESNRVLGCTEPARHHLRLSSTCAVVAVDWSVDDLLVLSTVLELNQSLSLGRRGPSRSDNGAKRMAGIEPADSDLASQR